ncbi:hypothetical protein G9A89_021011 [Geosiphon pyriformis]|nr:hypothetical protein G9A89_021011 [Geosiphon pyriformis]
MHPVDLQAIVNNTRDFKAAELKANHAQAINLVMNGSSELDSKLKQFSNSINQKLEGYQNHDSGVRKLEDESLVAIFLFEIEELTETPLFSGAALEEKPITAMYTNAKIDADGTTKTPIGEIDNLLIEINGIIVPIKVLVMEATQYQALMACGETLPDEEMWNDIPGQGGTMAYVKAEGTTTSELLEIKNNPLSLPEPEYVQTFDEQKQCLEEINTQLCDHCLIPCDFQYCNECDLIYNLPPHMIYMISKEDEPISNCASELESIFNPNSNSNNDDNKNTSSSSAQNSNKNNNNLDPNSNSETYIALPNLTKEQKLK